MKSTIRHTFSLTDWRLHLNSSIEFEQIKGLSLSQNVFQSRPQVYAEDGGRWLQVGMSAISVG